MNNNNVMHGPNIKGLRIYLCFVVLSFLSIEIYKVQTHTHASIAGAWLSIEPIIKQ